MTQAFNPTRLTLARRRRGLTKSALAEEMKVSRRIVTAYERGEKEPGAQNIAKMADRLRFPIEFFGGGDLEEPPLGGSSFRALSKMTARQRDQALGSGAIALVLSDWIDARFHLPESEVPRLRGVDPETAAIAVRTEWGLGERPATNMIHLLEANGVRVFSLVEECREMDAFSFWRREVPYVFLNTMKSAEHGRMDAAHELGHLVLHWREDIHGREAEQEANAFGSAFLMPRDSVIAEAPRGGSLSAILTAKQRWNVSAAALTYRMHKLGLLTDWQYRNLYIEMSRKGFRTAEPDGGNPESSQVLGKVLKALREEGVSTAHVADDLNISLEELDSVIFGLAITSIPGNGGEFAGSPTSKPNLRLL